MPDFPTASPPSPPIFLSYASEDAAAARRIAEALDQAGLVVWFDQSELRGGDAWDQRIRRQIKECALFMPVISAHTQARAEGYFRLEWHLAEQRSYLMAHDKPFIIPVVVDDTPDGGARVPDRFRERQWTRLPGGHVPYDFAPRVAQLLGGAAPRPAPRPASTPVVPPSPVLERTVAILAFANLSDERGNEYFSDGISDELLTVLQKIPGLRVAARTSAFSFKGKNASIREIGSALDVAHVVEGGVQRLGNRVKVAARLTTVSTGVVKWSGSYTREITDAFALQEELALAIVGELRGQLAGGDAALVQQATRGGTRVPAAYENYLVGRHLYEQLSDSPNAQATVHLRRATELDPNFALAWIALAATHLWRCSYSYTLTRAEFEAALADSRSTLERGLSLEPDLGAGLAIRGYIELAFDFDLKAATASTRRAEEIAPNDSLVMQTSTMLASVGRSAAESVELCRRVVARDPINARPHLSLAYSLANCGQFEEARAEANRFRALNPTAALAGSLLAIFLAMEGRYAEAERALDPSAAGWAEAWVRSILQFGLGRKAEADATLAEFIRLYRDMAAAQVAEVYGFRGEADPAFQWLEIARQQRDPGLFLTYSSPYMQGLAGDPRWAAFWRKLGIDVAA